MNFKIISNQMLLLLIFAGCGQSDPSKDVSQAKDTAPIPVSDWRELSPDEKFDDSVLQRVRLSDPKFENDKEWEHFMKNTVTPQLEKEIGGSFEERREKERKSGPPRFFKEG